MKSCLPVLVGMAVAAPLTAASADAPAHVRVCLSAAETRDAVTARKLVEPFAALKIAARLVKADPLRSRLCRWDDEFIYEMTLLPKDGKVVTVYLDAAAGRAVAPAGGQPSPVAAAPIATTPAGPPPVAPVADR